MSQLTVYLENIVAPKSIDNLSTAEKTKFPDDTARNLNLLKHSIDD